jgi:hypothetical protein
MSEYKWLDPEESETGKTLVGETVKLQVSCKDMEENTPVIFRVYKHTDNPKYGKPAEELQGYNKEGIAQQEWTYRYRHDPDNPLTEKPRFFFTTSSPRCKEEKSGEIEVGMKIDILVCNLSGKCLAELDYVIKGADGTEIKGKTTDSGNIYTTDILPGAYEVTFDLKSYKMPDSEPEVIDLDNFDECENNRMLVYFDNNSPIENNADKGSSFLYVIDTNMDEPSR